MIRLSVFLPDCEEYLLVSSVEGQVLFPDSQAYLPHSILVADPAVVRPFSSSTWKDLCYPLPCASMIKISLVSPAISSPLSTHLQAPPASLSSSPWLRAQYTVTLAAFLPNFGCCRGRFLAHMSSYRERGDQATHPPSRPLTISSPDPTPFSSSLSMVLDHLAPARVAAALSRRNVPCMTTL
jgi:hypothetical protein